MGLPELNKELSELEAESFATSMLGVLLRTGTDADEAQTMQKVLAEEFPGISTALTSLGLYFENAGVPREKRADLLSGAIAVVLAFRDMQIAEELPQFSSYE